MHCKDQVFFLHMRKVIGNDMDTFLWLDVWLKEATLLNLLDMHSPPAHSNSWKVSDIIEYGHGSLKEPALQTHGLSFSKLIFPSIQIIGIGLLLIQMYAVSSQHEM